jgi:hypothetical protein
VQHHCIFGISFVLHDSSNLGLQLDRVSHCFHWFFGCVEFHNSRNFSKLHPHCSCLLWDSPGNKPHTCVCVGTLFYENSRSLYETRAEFSTVVLYFLDRCGNAFVCVDIFFIVFGSGEVQSRLLKIVKEAEMDQIRNEEGQPLKLKLNYT